jgi:hypothetical protein
MRDIQKIFSIPAVLKKSDPDSTKGKGRNRKVGSRYGNSLKLQKINLKLAGSAKSQLL